MIIVLRPDATSSQIDHIVEKTKEKGLTPFVTRGVERTIVGLIGDERILAAWDLENIPGVEKVLAVLKPFKLASLDFNPERTKIKIGRVIIGDTQVVVIAGPCAVESESQIIETAQKVKEAGAHMLRGGAFKPRTSPYSFQGLAEEGLKYLAKAREETGLPFVTEVMDTRDVALVNEYADVVQIGARNMQNFALLKEAGKYPRPVLLKRGLSNTMEELLMSAEYIMSEGNMQVMLCERGIRTFEKATRNTLDISAIPVLKDMTHLPIIVDPSHGGGKWKWVAPLSKAAIAAGCDGLIIEVHPNPEEAVSDGSQSLRPDKFQKVMEELKVIAEAIGRRL
ncbi:MAG: 3-deoxy-7-phosphoheptulonate synthase [bacterium]|nr:3-deoxy-7-phosphoheptulonate synthase [bacterium]